MSTLWYILQSKPHKEEFLWNQLLAHRFEAFCPYIFIQPVNPRARKIKPYFPGYVFVYADLKQINLHTLQWMPGAKGLVAFGGKPAYVPENLVRAIRQRVDEVNARGCKPLESIKPGEIVTIRDGPFTGYEGIFDTHLPGTERVRVLLKLLQNRQILLELSSGQVELKVMNKNRR